MSYCRFSSDNWRCEVYVYEHCGGGFVTHVAGNKHVIPPIPEIPLSWMPRFKGKLSVTERRVIYPTRWHSAAASCFFGFCALWYRLSMWSLDVIPRKHIDLPEAGETFSHATAAECADNLERLRGVGFRVPQYAIDALREETTEAE